MTSPDFPRLQAALAALTAETPVRRILVVGCGEFRCGPAVRSLFPDALLCGIDLDWGALRIAADRRVIVADGAHLPFASAPGFDLILVRHPDVDRRPDRWRRVGLALGAFLGEGGRVVVSCYTRYELDAVREPLVQTGLAALALDQKILPPADLVGQDRVLLGLARPDSGPDARLSAPTRAESPGSCCSSP